MSQDNPTPEEVEAYARAWTDPHDSKTNGSMLHSFKAAFPDSKASNATISPKATRLHRLDKIQARIKELTEIAKKESEKQFRHSVESKMKMLQDVFNEGMKPKVIISDGVMYEGNACGLPSCVAAIDQMCKIDGSHAAVKHAIGGDKDAPPVEIKKIPADPVKAAALYSDMLSED